jgi:hypothetical protein
MGAPGLARSQAKSQRGPGCQSPQLFPALELGWGTPCGQTDWQWASRGSVIWSFTLFCLLSCGTLLHPPFPFFKDNRSCCPGVSKHLCVLSCIVT